MDPDGGSTDGRALGSGVVLRLRGAAEAFPPPGFVALPLLLVVGAMTGGMASRSAGVMRGSRVHEDGRSALATRYHMHWRVDEVCATVRTTNSSAITLSLSSTCKVDGVYIKSIAPSSDSPCACPRVPGKPSVEAAREGRRRDANTHRTPTSLQVGKSGPQRPHALSHS